MTLVHNPTAGDERDTEQMLLEKLKEAGHEARLVSGKKGLEKKLEDPGDVVAVAGGDGSVKQVVLALAGGGVPLAILPIGTANNIAKSLGSLGTFDELIAGWRKAERRRLAVGTVATRWGARRFVESAGTGLFAELVIRGPEEIDENAAGLTGHAIDRALLLLQRIVAERHPIHRRVELDGADVSGEYLLVEAMNIPLVGPNIPLAPGADFGDRRLELVTISERERGALADYVRARLAGEAARLELPRRSGEQIVLHASPAELHVDDDAWKSDPNHDHRKQHESGEGEVTIALGDDAVEVLVPTRPQAA
ncbi:MAG: diacylglycerol kinase family protein [Gemmatimonadales bacterium]